MRSTFNPIAAVPGVQPVTDAPTATTPHYIAADKIRFRNGFPEKIGGWQIITINNNKPINGCARAIFSYTFNANVRYLIGTHSDLYHLFGSVLTNITPLATATTAIPNSLDSDFRTLPNNPINTIQGSNTLRIRDFSRRVRAGDPVTLSGSTAVNGVPAVEINTTHFVRTLSGNNDYTVLVTTAATTGGSGGGIAVVQATSIITVNQTAHGFSVGERIIIASAAVFAGIPAGDINQEHVTRNNKPDVYDIVVATTATSSVSGGGGAATTVRGQIIDGLCDATAAQGYGAGLYGVGLYGTARTSSGGVVTVRVWIFDRFGDNVLMTAGQQTNIYTWDSNINIAPVILANAPTAVDYIFVSNEIVVTLGASGKLNRIQWSDQGISTVWVDLLTNQAGQDDIEGAGAFISQINVRGVNLLFTDTQVYTFRYLGRPLIWETKRLDDKSGIIAKNARIQHNGIAYWMGSDNFYLYRGGNVEIVPSNSTKETTLKKFIFENLNSSQKSKIFCWYNRKFNEIWWHYPSAGSVEPDRVARLNVTEFTWTPDTHNRSAGEYPTPLREFPYLAEVDTATEVSTLFQHEKGTDDNGSSLAWSLSTPFFDSGQNTVNVKGLVPDSTQIGNITVAVNVKKFAQSASLYGTTNLTITPTTEFQSFRETNRYRQYVISGNVLGQIWRAGTWLEQLSEAGER